MHYSSSTKASRQSAQRYFKPTSIAIALGVTLTGMAHAADANWSGSVDTDITIGQNWSTNVSPFAVNQQQGITNPPPDTAAVINTNVPLATLANPRAPAAGEQGTGTGALWDSAVLTSHEVRIGSGASANGKLSIVATNVAPPTGPFAQRAVSAVIIGTNGQSSATPATTLAGLPKPSLSVGENGGTGELNVDTSHLWDGITLPSDMPGGIPSKGSGLVLAPKSGGLGVGVGVAGKGTMNVLGAGKSIIEQNQGRSVYLGGAIVGGGGGDATSELAPVQVGVGGGDGTVNITNTGFILGGEGARLIYAPELAEQVRANGTFVVGANSQSKGNVSVLGGSKFVQGYEQLYLGPMSQTSPKFRTSETHMTRVGVNGGTGTITLSGTGEDPALAPSRGAFRDGIAIGKGGTGNLDVLSGGKAWTRPGSSADQDARKCEATFYDATHVAPMQISDGTDGSVATVRVNGQSTPSGAHPTHLLVTGHLIDQNPNEQEQGLPANVQAQNIGRIDINKGGQLVVANDGLVQVGATTWIHTTGDRGFYQHLKSWVGGLGSIDVKGGSVVYGGAPGEAAAAPGKFEASYINTVEGASVAFNHNGQFSFNLPVYGAGKLEQIAGTTFVSKTLAPAMDPSTGKIAWDANCTTAPQIYPANAAPADQTAFTGTIEVKGDTLVLPSPDVLANTSATLLSGGVLNMASTDSQKLGKVTLATGATLALSGAPIADPADAAAANLAAKVSTAPQATDTAYSTGWVGNGGTVSLDTVLGDSSSASDKLDIAGPITGQTVLQITNLGGAGALTGAPGILVVQSTTASQPDAFSLAAPIVQGGYAYTLKQSGTNWYLVSELVPVVPVISTVTDDFGDLQGPVSNGGTTDDTTPTVVGTGTPGSIITVYAGTTALGTATVDAQGNWTLTPTTPLASGAYQLTATQKTTADGAESAATPVYAITVETPNVISPPVAPAITSAESNTGGTIAPVSNGGTTDDTTPALSGTGVPGNTVTLLDGTTPVGTATVGADGKWTITPTTPLAEGAHSFTATQANAKGDVSPASGTFTLTVKAQVVGPTNATPVPTTSVLGLGLLSALIAGASALASRRRKRNA